MSVSQYLAWVTFSKELKHGSFVVSVWLVIIDKSSPSMSNKERLFSTFKVCHDSIGILLLFT